MTKEEIIKPENLVYKKPTLMNDNFCATPLGQIADQSRIIKIELWEIGRASCRERV